MRKKVIYSVLLLLFIVLINFSANANSGNEYTYIIKFNQPHNVVDQKITTDNLHLFFNTNNCLYDEQNMQYSVVCKDYYDTNEAINKMHLNPAFVDVITIMQDKSNLNGSNSK